MGAQEIVFIVTFCLVHKSQAKSVISDGSWCICKINSMWRWAAGVGWSNNQRSFWWCERNRRWPKVQGGCWRVEPKNKWGNACQMQVVHEHITIIYERSWALDTRRREHKNTTDIIFWVYDVICNINDEYNLMQQIAEYEILKSYLYLLWSQPYQSNTIFYSMLCFCYHQRGWLSYVLSTYDIIFNDK
jgi:hypothetical protein